MLHSYYRNGSEFAGIPVDGELKITVSIFMVIMLLELANITRSLGGIMSPALPIILFLPPMATVIMDTSVGFSLYPLHGKNREELIHHADNGMYHEKKESKRTKYVGETKGMPVGLLNCIQN